MGDFMIPTNDEFVEAVAMAIARDRLYKDAYDALQYIGSSLAADELLSKSFDQIFDRLWQGTTDVDMKQKESYRDDARAAISAINLKLLTKI